MRRLSWLTAAFLLMLGLSGLSVATAFAQSVAQSYGVASPLSPGLIVKLKDSDPSKVEPLTQASTSKMFGVVVDPNEVSETLSTTSSSTQAYVATSGTYNVLVSNQNGVIHAGDYVTISSLDGTGMKDNSTASLVLGKAAGNFDGKTGVVSTTSLKVSNGGQLAVAIGRIPVVVAITRNPEQANNQPNVPGFLARASQNIANKPVSTLRVYLSLAVLLISALIAGSLLFAAVRSSFVAIGRNPLAKKAIIRDLLQVSLTSLIVFIIGVFAVYLLLKL